MPLRAKASAFRTSLHASVLWPPIIALDPVLEITPVSKWEIPLLGFILEWFGNEKSGNSHF